MWGLSLDDIARKAQEAAEEASKTMSSQGAGANSFFNLDSMRDLDPRDAEEAELRAKVSQTLQQQKQHRSNHGSTINLSSNSNHGESISSSKHSTSSGLHNASTASSSSSLMMIRSNTPKKKKKELSSIDVDILLNSNTPSSRRSKVDSIGEGFFKVGGGDATTAPRSNVTTTPSAKGLWGSVLNTPTTSTSTSTINVEAEAERSGTTSKSIVEQPIRDAGAGAGGVSNDKEVVVTAAGTSFGPAPVSTIEISACPVAVTSIGSGNVEGLNNDESFGDSSGQSNTEGNYVDVDVDHVSEPPSSSSAHDQMEERVHAENDILMSNKSDLTLNKSRSLASDAGLAAELKNLDDVSERINKEVDQQDNEFDDGNFVEHNNNQKHVCDDEIEDNDVKGDSPPTGWGDDEKDTLIDDDEKDGRSVDDPNKSMIDSANIEASENNRSVHMSEVGQEENGSSSVKGDDSVLKSLAGDETNLTTNIEECDKGDVINAEKNEKNEKNFDIIAHESSQKTNDAHETSELCQHGPQYDFSVEKQPKDGQVKEDITGTREVADRERALQGLKRELESAKLEYEKNSESLRRQYEERIKEVEVSSNEHLSRVENDNKILRQQIERLGTQFSATEKRNQLYQKEKAASMQDLEDASGTVDALKTALSISQDENATLGHQYDALRERVKTVALELKDRRAECRDLTAKNLDLQKESSDYEAKVYELSKRNEKIEALNGELEKKNKDLSANEGGHNEKVSTLAVKNVELENKVQHIRSLLESTETKLKESLSINTKLENELENKTKASKEESERNLESYKRKAQAALSSANARAAAAIQAREEAELEAINARELVEDAENSRTHFELLENQIKGELSASGTKILELETLLKEKGALLEKNGEELSKLSEDHSSIYAENSNLKSYIDDLEKKVGDTQTRVIQVTDKLTVEKEKCNNLSQKILESQVELEATSTNRENVTSTIHNLKEEVKESNEAIVDLKDALKSALLEKQALLDNQESGVPSTMPSNSHSSVATEPHSQGGNSTTPLFYALEKQAELVTAREEITRLASLLGDAHQDREEALQEALICRKQLEETEAMLQRQNKMGRQRKAHEHDCDAAINIGKTTESSYDHMCKVESSADINLEYLKNIMLKYLSAKSFSERRALIPAIAAVLCLTHEETQQAVASVDLSGGVQGVGNALLDSLASFRSPMKK